MGLPAQEARQEAELTMSQMSSVVAGTKLESRRDERKTRPGNEVGNKKETWELDKWPLGRGLNNLINQGKDYHLQ